MKNILIILGLFISITTFAQKSEVIKIKTSAQCEMCKKRIENSVKQINGVQRANLNLKDKTITVKFSSPETTIDIIRAAISNAGYDADEVKANTDIYDKLPDCCKKP